MNIIFVSGGNDSVALCQFAFENGLQDVVVCHSNTGWSSDEWPERIKKFDAWVTSNGARFFQIESEGMESLIFRKKAWPTNGMAFCSYELKIKPAQEWLESIDPNKEATCLTGVRREESAKRANWPEWVEESANHGGRSLYSPLVRHTEEQRNGLIVRAGFEVLPHRSRECWPCVNADKATIAELTPSRVAHIEALEERMGTTGKGAARVLFRANKKKGAQGIREVWQWAQTNNFIAGQADFFCDSGFCGG